MLLATVPPCLWWGTPSLGEAVMVDICFDLFSSSHLHTRPHTPTHPHTHTPAHMHRGHDGCHSTLTSYHTHTYIEAMMVVTLLWSLYIITHTHTHRLWCHSDLTSLSHHTHTHTHTEAMMVVTLLWLLYLITHTHTYTHPICWDSYKISAGLWGASHSFLCLSYCFPHFTHLLRNHVATSHQNPYKV